MKKITILNTSILTAYGRYEYKQTTLSGAQYMLGVVFCDFCYTLGQIGQCVCSEAIEVVSAVGHQSTADILTELLTIPVKMNRIEYRQEIGDEALIFKLKARAPEGVILSREEIEAIGYEFGVLTRLSDE